MPYLTIIVAPLLNEAKDKLVSAWPAQAEEINALPQVLGTRGGVVVAEDGAAATDFQFLQTMGKCTIFQLNWEIDRFNAS